MTPIPDPHPSSLDRPLPVRLRPDLEVHCQRSAGREFFLLKDGITGQYHRFNSEQYALLRMLDGRTSWRNLQRSYEEQFAPQRISIADLQCFVARACRDALLVENPEHPFRPAGAGIARTPHTREKGTLENLLCSRWPLCNPDRLLTVLCRYFGWLFSVPGLLAGITSIASAIVLAFAESGTFQIRVPQLPDLLTAGNWLTLAVIFTATRILHELGHGIACKYYGRSCREMGVLFYLFMPCLYCNVSDSWTLRCRWQRALVAAAGMYVELCLAAVCTWLWWFSEPGGLHDACLNVMVVCALSTVAFNANPLLRYDGYFILSDCTGVVNLRQKAAAAWHGLFAAIFIKSPGRPSVRPHRLSRWALLGYGLAAFVYRSLVIVTGVTMLTHALRPYSLQCVGHAAACVAAYVLLVNPARRGLQAWQVPGRWGQVRHRRLAIIAVGSVGLVGIVCLVPWKHFVYCRCTVEPQKAAAIYAPAAGVLRQIHVRHGQRVQQGQLLVTLDNIDLQMTIEETKGQCAELSRRLAGLRQAALRGDQATLQDVRTLTQTMADLQSRLAALESKRAACCVVSPFEGTVLMTRTPSLTAQSDNRRQPKATRVVASENLGGSINEGDFLCRVVATDRWMGQLVLDAQDTEFVSRGQSVRLQLNHRPDEILASRISGVTAANLPSKTKPHSVRYDEARCLAVCELPDAVGVNLLGAQGRARVDVGSATLFERLLRYCYATF